MYLKKLEIQGFKSFANKVALEFPKTHKDDKGVTAIVGPNGSGKSNVSDAIRWVLGEQSVKTLRGKKTEDLIFAGSNKRSRLGLAEVSLYLDNTEGIAPIEYTDIEITRRVYRSGESEYLLNKQTVRLSDIVLLLAKAKFAQKTYSVISQGTIDAVLIAPPTERKEFFDEAAGVKEFQIKRDQSLNKLKNTQTNLQQVDIMLQEIEPRLRSLTRQVKRLERREEVEKELKEDQVKYYSSLLFEINQKIKLVEDKKAEVKPKVELLQRELIEIQKKLDQASKQEVRTELFSQLQRELSSLVGQKNSLLREQAILKGKLDVEYAKSGQINLVWLEKRDDEVKNRLLVLENELRQKQNSKIAEEELFTKKNILTKIEQEINLLKTKIEEINQSRNKLSDHEIKQVLQEIFDLQKEFIEKLQNTSELNELAEIKTSASLIYKKITNFKDSYFLTQDLEGIKKEIEHTQNALKFLQEEKVSLITEINEISVSIKISQEKVVLLNREIEREKNELVKIKNEIDQSKNATQNNVKVDEVKINLQSQEIDQQMHKLDIEMLVVQKKLNEFNEEEEKKRTILIQLQREYSTKQSELYSLNNRLNETNVEFAKISTRKEDLQREVVNELKSLEVIIKDFSENIDRNSLFNRIQQSKHQLELIGGIDEEVVNEYNQIKERYEFLHTQTTDLKNAIKSLDQIITELDKTILKEFNNSFTKINKEFDKYFKILFNGGTAKLVKITEEDLLENKTEKELAMIEANKEAQSKEEATEEKQAEDELYDIKKKFKKNNIYAGIDIKAMPPDKKVSSINLLSGGERALTAIALVCAIISCNPSPFVVLDEVDAALDEANSERFSSILHQLSHQTQFIVITHNRSTMHQAKILYGVTMGEDGVSRLLSVKLAEAEKLEAEGKVKMV
jgi:chromosome segregation protein